MKRPPRFSGVIVLAALFAFAGCDSIKDIFGESGAAKGTTDPHKERIAILQASKTVEPDKDLKGKKIDLPKTETNAEWRQAGFDPSHLMPNAALADHPQQIWSSNIGEGSNSDFKLLARPIVGGGMAFTMDSEGTVRGFSAKDGSETWEFDTTPPNRDASAMGGGIGYIKNVVYATTGFGEVLALNAATGKLYWRRMLLNPIRGAPTIAGGRVYVVSIDNELFALDARRGDVLWHHRGISEPATLMGASNPAVSNDSVVAAYSSGEIFDLRPENGRVAWNYTLTVPTQVGALPAIADIRGLPVIDGGRIYAISHSGRIAAIDLRIGDRVWETDIGGINTPVVADSAIFILSNDNELMALDRESGRIMWVQELQKLEDPTDKDSDRLFWAGPVLGGDRLWLTNSLGQLVAFSPADGSQLDAVDLGAPCFITPVIAGKTIYVVTDDGALTALQ